MTADRGSQRLSLSVVVAVRNAKATLASTLAAIRQSQLPRDSYELIVVDDASTDGSAAIAARYADTVVRLSGRKAGPAYSRNRGAELSRAPIVAFVADDVLVRPETLPKMLSVLSAQSGIDAVSASNDEKFGAPSFVSDYWNLLVSYGEKRQTGRCAQFASSCGVVRRDAFLNAGMYDEWRFPTGGVESVELGERLLAAGHEVMLSGDLKVSQIRRWDIADLAREIWHRGRALARSLGYVRIRTVAPGEVVFTLSRTLTPALALLTTVMLAAAFVPAPHMSAKWAVALAAVLSANLPMYRYYARERGVAFALIAAPLHLFAQSVAAIALCVGWVLRDLVGDISPDATTQAYAEVGLQTWPPVPRKR
jgi:GT2 family glycosyltransferase